MSDQSMPARRVMASQPFVLPHSPTAIHRSPTGHILLYLLCVSCNGMNKKPAVNATNKLIKNRQDCELIIAAILIIAGSVLMHSEQGHESLRSVIQALPAMFSPVEDFIKQVLL